MIREGFSLDITWLLLARHGMSGSWCSSGRPRIRSGLTTLLCAARPPPTTIPWPHIALSPAAHAPLHPPQVLQEQIKLIEALQSDAEAARTTIEADLAEVCKRHSPLPFPVGLLAQRLAPQAEAKITATDEEFAGARVHLERGRIALCEIEVVPSPRATLGHLCRLEP